MSENYDYPPASSRPPPVTDLDVTSRLQHWRNILLSGQVPVGGYSELDTLTEELVELMQQRIELARIFGDIIRRGGEQEQEGSDGRAPEQGGSVVGQNSDGRQQASASLSDNPSLGELHWQLQEMRDLRRMILDRVQPGEQQQQQSQSQSSEQQQQQQQRESSINPSTIMDHQPTSMPSASRRDNQAAGEQRSASSTSRQLRDYLADYRPRIPQMSLSELMAAAGVQDYNYVPIFGSHGESASATPANWTSFPWTPDPYLLDWERGPSRAESPSRRLRAKRRKLDSDDRRGEGFTYGHYGQVVPGLLKMEIASCDGGVYYDDGTDLSSRPSNVLVDDSSVYSTRQSRCNLVLRHRGETPFCVKKIVIKAPKEGYDAAIQQGMIFVSMTSEGLLERTSRYQIRYPPSSGRLRCHRHRRRGMPPSEEYINSYNPVTRSLDTASNSNNNAHPQSNIYPQIDIVEDQLRVSTDYDENSDAGEGSNTNTSTAAATTPMATNPRSYLRTYSYPPIITATEPILNTMDMDTTDEEEELFCPDDDEGDDPSHDHDDDNDDDDDDDDDDEDEDEDDFLTSRSVFDQSRHLPSGVRRRMRSSSNHHHHHHRRSFSSRMDQHRFEPSSASTNPTTSTEILKPHAYFFIERGKSMVRIKFDPPPSGRFILIKLWSPYSGGNIDIQSVMVYGYAGPRFLPAVEMR